MDLTDNVPEIVKIGGVLFASFHFLVGFVMYRDMVRINRVLKTKNSGVLKVLSVVYILLLLIIIIIIAII